MPRKPTFRHVFFFFFKNEKRKKKKEEKRCWGGQGMSFKVPPRHSEAVIRHPATSRLLCQGCNLITDGCPSLGTSVKHPQGWRHLQAPHMKILQPSGLIVFPARPLNRAKRHLLLQSPTTDALQNRRLAAVIFLTSEGVSCSDCTTAAQG